MAASPLNFFDVSGARGGSPGRFFQYGQINSPAYGVTGALRNILQRARDLSGKRQEFGMQLALQRDKNTPVMPPGGEGLAPSLETQVDPTTGKIFYTSRRWDPSKGNYEYSHLSPVTPFAGPSAKEQVEEKRNLKRLKAMQEREQGASVTPVAPVGGDPDKQLFDTQFQYFIDSLNNLES
jgi:hypothetical protein